MASRRCTVTRAVSRGRDDSATGRTEGRRTSEDGREERGRGGDGKEERESFFLVQNERVRGTNPKALQR